MKKFEISIGFYFVVLVYALTSCAVLDLKNAPLQTEFVTNATNGELFTSSERTIINHTVSQYERFQSNWSDPVKVAENFADFTNDFKSLVSAYKQTESIISLKFDQLSQEHQNNLSEVNRKALKLEKELEQFIQIKDYKDKAVIVAKLVASTISILKSLKP